MTRRRHDWITLPHRKVVDVGRGPMWVALVILAIGFLMAWR